MKVALQAALLITLVAPKCVSPVQRVLNQANPRYDTPLPELICFESMGMFSYIFEAGSR